MKIQNQSVKLNRKTAFTFKKVTAQQIANASGDPTTWTIKTIPTTSINCTY